MNPYQDIFFENGNINNLKIQQLKFGATNVYNDDTMNLNVFKISNNDGSNINLSKEKTFLTTDKVGINTANPSQTLDVNGSLKVEDSLHGTNNKKILSQVDNSINLNPNEDYNGINLKGKFSLINGGLSVGTSDVEVGHGELLIDNGIYDKKKNRIISLEGENINLNSDNKNLNIRGKVKFDDANNGVNIGLSNVSPASGELNVSNKITTNMIEVSEDGDRKINFKGSNDSSVHFGNNSISSMTRENNSSLLLGNNLEVKDSNIIVKDTEFRKYSGIVLNGDNIEFHNKDENSYRGENTLDKPNLTLSHDGQLIYTIPIINLTNGKTEIDKENERNEVYEYVRSHLTDKQIGSSITFSVNTSKYFLSDKFFNFVKNRDNFARGYLINKLTNNTEEVYEVEFS